MKEADVEHAIFNTINSVVSGFGHGKDSDLTLIGMKRALEFVKDEPF